MRRFRGNRFSALGFAGLALCALVVAFSLREYGGESVLPALATSFAGTFAAFMLALAWERDRDRRRGQDEARLLNLRRTTEVRRRFEPIWAELGRNARSLGLLSEVFELKARREDLEPASPLGFAVLNPELLEGAWTASAPRLSDLVADYKLIADLAVAYGRIEELRWRLRHRTEHQRSDLDEMTASLVDELRTDVAGLLERVRQQIDEPSVQPLGLVHAVSGSIGGTGKPIADLTMSSRAELGNDDAGPASS